MLSAQEMQHQESFEEHSDENTAGHLKV